MPYVFERLMLEGWRQFEEVRVLLHPRLTVITGANGSGKSTILSIFSRHFGWNRAFLSTPIKKKNGEISYFSGLIRRLWHVRQSRRPESSDVQIGELRYSNGIESIISINDKRSVQYDISIEDQQHVLGTHIDAYRPSPVYTAVQTIPLQPITAAQAFANYNSELIQRWSGSMTYSSPIFRLKEALIAMAIFGEGNSMLGSNDEMLRTINGFSFVLQNLLPESLGFQRISVRSPEVVLVTKSGEFMIDAASGGVSALIDIAWRIYMLSRDQSQFVVTIDEPENHLHPAMQRTLMRRLLSAFPDIQFIIATHSPFIVSSVRDSHVYVLQHKGQNKRGKNIEDVHFGSRSAPPRFEMPDPESRVTSIYLDRVDKAGSANDILREVLGVPATIPEWVEDRIQTITSAFVGQPITKELLAELRRQLDEIGYGEYFSEALSDLVKQ